MSLKPDPTPASPPTNTPESASGNGKVRNNAARSAAPKATNLPEQQLIPGGQEGDKQNTANYRVYPIALSAIALMGVGLVINNFWIGIVGAIVALLVSAPVVWQGVRQELIQVLSPEQRSQIAATLIILTAIAGVFQLLGFYQYLGKLSKQIQWEAFGTMADWVGALGQIFIALLAAYIAWQQYVISKELTIEQNRLTSQQNILTQQQTIDTYFQGISDLALDDEGFLEDWPQEQAFAEGRTAALLSSVDAFGKAKVLRFLSQAKLLAPLKRDRRLGRPIFNGDGGYEEDRIYGVRVIDLGVMLAGADLSGTDLRWTDLSEANLVRANLSRCDLIKANLSRTILYEATLVGADLKNTRLFYGSVETASPRSRTEPPNYRTGAHTGAVVESADFTGVKELSEEQRYYCCAWGGENTRATIPGGCSGIPNKLGR